MITKIRWKTAREAKPRFGAAPVRSADDCETRLQLRKPCSHVSLSQVSGLLVSIGGFVCAIMSVPFDHFMFVHGTIGLLVMFVGLLQPLNAFL